jgi:uncharacterized membrane protein YuzA (DUF378 family)
MSVPHDRVHSADSHSASRFNALDWIAMILMIVGGLNWGLVGAFNLDLVALLFGEMTTLARAVYILVGVAALYGFALMAKMSGARSA